MDYKYATGTMYAGTDTRHKTLKEAYGYLNGFTKDELWDNDDSFIIVELENGEESPNSNVIYSKSYSDFE